MMTNSIEINELNKCLSTGDTVTLLDVRRKRDYEATPQKIAGAVWRDPEKIDRWVTQLPVGDRTVVYCVKGGSVSQSVVERLRGEGLDAMLLEGGLKAWIDNGQSIQDVRPINKTYVVQASDMNLLRKAGVSEDDIAHSVKVAEKALERYLNYHREIQSMLNQ